MLKPRTLGSNLGFLSSGVLRRASDGRQRFAALRRIRSVPAATSSPCPCAGRQPAGAQDSLLVVQGLASLEALRAALQPVCGGGSTGASQTVPSTVANVSPPSLLGNNEGAGCCIMRRALDSPSCRLQRHLEPRGGLRHHVSAVQRLLVSKFWSPRRCGRSRGPVPFRQDSRPGKL